jgi:hypothetical protein
MFQATTHTSGSNPKAQIFMNIWIASQSFDYVSYKAIDKHCYIILASIQDMTTIITVKPCVQLGVSIFWNSSSDITPKTF